ncbi:hypothetical protein G6F32_014653 [Rhizopus arrhizus]|nr:hypothetical protein G6F32_014653 [Rhizopus arrhizus]
MISLWASSMACLTVSPTPLVASATLLPTVLSDGEEVPPQAISGRHSRVAGNRRNSFMGDPATDIAVLDVAAAAVVDGQAATHAVDLDVARTVAADRHIATDVGQVDATGADHADFNAALHALELDIARTDGIQPGIAAHIADLPVAGADRTAGSANHRHRC